MIVTMTLDPQRTEDVVRHFYDDVIPWAQRQPGFRSGHWLSAPALTRGIGIVFFDTVESANAAAVGPRGQQHDERRAWNTDTVEVFLEVAHARSTSRVPEHDKD